MGPNSNPDGKNTVSSVAGKKDHQQGLPRPPPLFMAAEERREGAKDTLQITLFVS